MTYTIFLDAVPDAVPDIVPLVKAFAVFFPLTRTAAVDSCSFWPGSDFSLYSSCLQAYPLGVFEAYGTPDFDASFGATARR
jgi:hypothetical protein